MTVPAIGIGMLVAPGTAGWLASGRGFMPVLIFGALSLGGSLLVFIYAAAIERKGSTSTVVVAPDR